MPVTPQQVKENLDKEYLKNICDRIDRELLSGKGIIELSRKEVNSISVSYLMDLYIVKGWTVVNYWKSDVMHLCFNGI